MILDWRDQVTPRQRRDACKHGPWGVVTRPLESVTGAMLHQTACWYGVAPYQARAANGDETLARHRRALDVHAHMTAMRHGSTVVAYGPEVYVNHGDVLNDQTIGLEHEGLYDANGEPLKMPKGVDVGAIIDAGREALTWLVEHAPHVRIVWAHRQSRRAPKAAKTADPGARIFREVGIEHGVKKLGLTIDPEKAFGSGRALPPYWYSNIK
jgi:hypothetical protein